jgi:hypothetical protein
MKRSKGNITIIACLLIAQSLIAISIPKVNANTDIPEKFYQKLDLHKEFRYNVSRFNSSKSLQWADVDYFSPVKGYAQTNEGGEVRVNFTGFYKKDPSDLFNDFESPMPYLDIKFFESENGALTLNNTFLNVSNGEAAQNLLLGYNTFKSGFMIPTNNFTRSVKLANSQDEPPYWNATISIEETRESITFNFKQEVGFEQKTLTIYDKTTGLLTYTNTSVGNYYLEMQILNHPVIQQIPSYPLIYLISIASISTIMYVIFLQKRKLK